MKLALMIALLVSCAMGVGQDHFPDVPTTPTRPFVQSVIEELFERKILMRPSLCKPAPSPRYEQAVALHAAYQAFIDPKVRARLGSGYADLVMEVRKASALREKELASLGVDVEAMKLHLCALAQGKGFADVPPNHWASKATRSLKDLGLLKGYPDALFRGE